MPTTPLSVVLDTNIFIQYFLSPLGAAGKCLEAVEQRKAKLFISTDILKEVRDVLLRPSILSRVPNTSSEQIEVFLRYLTDIATFVEPDLHKFILERDPKDEFIIDLAIEARANYIVSCDRDLLDLMTGHTNECKDFRRRFRAIKIIRPAEFLAALERGALS